MQELNIRLTGVSSVMMHSDRYANPLDPMTKAHKALTSNRKKTDEIHEAIAKSEWRGAMYYADDIGPYFPSQNLRALIVTGAKYSKLGSTVKRAVLVNSADGRLPLQYDGPRDVEGLWSDGRFTDTRSVVVSRARLMRTRPIFPGWSIEGSLLFDEDVVEEDQLMNALEVAGRLVGFGEFRPECGGNFGRFRVEKN